MTSCQTLTTTINQNQQNKQSKSVPQSSGKSNTDQEDIKKISLLKIYKEHLGNPNLPNVDEIISKESHDLSKSESEDLSTEDSIKQIIQPVEVKDFERVPKHKCYQESQWEYVEDEERCDEGGQGYFMEMDFNFDDESICKIHDLQQLLDNINLNLHKFPFNKKDSCNLKQPVAGDRYNIQNKKDEQCKSTNDLEFLQRNNRDECQNSLEVENIHCVDDVMETDNNVSKKETVMKQDENGKLDNVKEKAIMSVDENVMSESEVLDSSDSPPSFLLIPSF